MTRSIFSEGKEYISASRAAKKTGYASDYIGQLCRAKKIPGQLIGRTWYVDSASLLEHQKNRQIGGVKKLVIKKFIESKDQTLGNQEDLTLDNLANGLKSVRLANEHDKNALISSPIILPRFLNKPFFTYKNDDRPRLPELSKKGRYVEPIWTSTLTKQAIALTLSLLVAISAGFLTLENTNPQVASEIRQSVENISEVPKDLLATLPTFVKHRVFNTIGHSQVAAVSFFNAFSNLLEGVRSGFRSLKQIALDKFFFSPTPPQLTYTTTVTPSSPPPSRALTTPAPSINLGSLKSELKTELESYIRIQIDSILPDRGGTNSPVVVYTSAPSLATADFESFKNNEVIPITYNVVTRQSDSDSGRLSSVITNLTSDGDFTKATFDTICLSSDTCRTSWPTSGSGSSSDFAWTPTTYGVSTSTTLGFLNGFLSTASSTINSNLIITGNSTTTSATTTNFYSSSLTAGNATTTNLFSTTASSTNLAIGNSLSIFGTTGTVLSDFCVKITGGSGLCDGSDDSGAGISAFEIATTSDIAVPNLAYFTQVSGRTTLGSVATGTISVPTGLTITANRYAVGGAAAIGLDTGYVIPLQSTLDAKALGATTLTIAGTAGQITSSAGAQDISTNRTWTLSLPSFVQISNLTLTDSTTTRATTTNATSTNFFATTASSTNLFGTSGNLSTLTINSSASIPALSNLTSNGFVKTSGSNGTLSIDTTAYLSSYDAWTHPAYGGSATTSLLTLSGGFLNTAASSTIAGNLLITGNSTTTHSTSTSFYSSSLTAGNATTTNLFSTTASSTNLYSTNLFGNTANLSESGNLFYTDARVNSYIHASTTIPKTYTANTFTGAQIFNDITRSTTTNATTTNFFSTTASSTNLFTQLFTLNGFTLSSTANGTIGGTNTGDVTLAGTPDYLTISGQQITRTKLDISDDTNATGGLGITLTTNDFACDTANTTTFGCLSSTDWNTFNNKLGAYDAWTHPAYGGSATTSLLTLSGGFLNTAASSTIAGNLLITGNSTTTHSTSTSFYSSSLTAGNATTTNFFSTTASSTNLFSSLLTVGGNGLVVDSSRNVGIGITDPSAKLEVSGTNSSTFGGGSVYLSASSAFNQYFDYDYGLVFRGPGGVWNARVTGTSNLAPTAEVFGIYKEETSEGDVKNDAPSTGAIAVFKNDGTVGIGTTTPTWLLNPTSASASQLALSAGAGFSQWAFRNAGGNLYLATTTVAGTATSSVSALTIDLNGNVGVATTSPVAGFAVATHCVTGDTKLRRRTRRRQGYGGQGKKKDDYDYDEVMIKDVEEGDEIQSLDEKTGKLVWSRVNKLMYMGEKEIWKITTASGKTIRTTSEHPYLVRSSFSEGGSVRKDSVSSLSMFNFSNFKSISTLKSKFNSIITFAQTIIFGFSSAHLKYLRMLQGVGEGLEFSNGIKYREAEVSGNSTKFFVGSRVNENLEHQSNSYDLDFLTLAYTFSKGIQEFLRSASRMRRPVSRISVGVESSIISTISSKILLDTSFAGATTPRNFPSSIIVTDNLVIGRKYSSAVAVPSRERGVWTKVKAIKEGEFIAIKGENDKAVYDKIIKIELLPSERVYDIEVEGTHNFIGNDIVAHNTYLGGNLTVQGTTNFANILTTGSTTLQNFTFGNATGTSATTTNLFSTTASSTNLFSSLLTVGGTGLIVDSSRNVGIGTASPNSNTKLEVVGPLFTSSAGQPGDIFIGGGGWPYSIGVGWNGQDSTLRFNAVGTNGGTTAFRDTWVYDGKSNVIAAFQGSTGNVGIGETAPGSKLSVSGGGTFGASYDTTAAPTNGLLVEGNVGIGTTSPYAKLSVVGGTSGTAIGVDMLTGYSGNIMELKVASTTKFVINQNGDFIASGNSTTTNSTTTSLFSTTASSTNLYSSLFTLAGNTLTLSSNATIGGTNTGDVTLAGTPDYLTISGQQITRNKLDISDDTNATGGLGLTLTANDFACDTASASVFGCLASADWTTFNNKLGSYDAWTHPAYGGSATTSLLTLSGGFLNTAASSTIAGNLLITGNSTTTNATTTNFFSTTASSTNLFSSLLTVGGTGLIVDSNRSVGIGSTSPWGLLSINPNNITGPSFVVGSSTATNFIVTNGGNVGIGTTSPGYKLHIWDDDNVSGTPTAHTMKIENIGNDEPHIILSGNRSTANTAVDLLSFQWNGNAMAQIAGISGSDTTNKDEGHLVFSTRNDGNADVVERMRIDKTGNVGIGTTTPTWLLNPTSATASQLALSAGAGFSQWAFRNAGGNLYLATTTVAGTATSSVSALSINSNGLLTLPSYGGATGCAQFSTAGLLSNTGTACGTGGGGSDPFTHPIAGVSATTSSMIFTNASSTFTGNLNITGNSTTTNATTTNLFSTTASSTNLFSSLLTVGGTGLIVDSNRSVGIGSTTPFAKLSLNGDAWFNSNLIQFASSSASTLTLNYLASATSTIPNNKLYAWTIATSTTATPIFRIDTTSSGAGSISATTSIRGGFVLDDGVFNYDSFAGVTSADSLSTGPMAFDDNAGILSWINMPVSTTTADIVMSYSAQIGDSPLLTLYAESLGTGGGVKNKRVGIGTTSPYALLSLATTTNQLIDLFVISTSTSGTVFKVDSYGQTFGDGAYSSPAADYAEYFYTKSVNLKSGEVVCVDILENNAVKRCERGADNNVMGIVSTKPAVIGNYIKAAETDPSHYTIIGMLGQVDAFVSAENGPINIGDSLTSASSTPGFAMLASGGDSTVGIALEPMASSTGKIKVLISRRNKSLAVEEVEALVVERVANMKIEDKVGQMVKQSVDNLNLNMSKELTENFNSLFDSLKIQTLASTTLSLSSRLDDIESIFTSTSTTTAASTSSPQADSLAGNFFKNLFNRLTEWFASAANGIGDFFANRVHTKELCVADDSGETCITKAQLDALIIGASSSGERGVITNNSQLIEPEGSSEPERPTTDNAEEPELVSTSTPEVIPEPELIEPEGSSEPERPEPESPAEELVPNEN